MDEADADINLHKDEPNNIRSKLFNDHSVDQQRFKLIYTAIKSSISQFDETANTSYSEIPCDLIKNIAEYASGTVKCWNYKNCSNTISPSEYDTKEMEKGTDNNGWDILNEYIFTLESLYNQAKKYISEYGYFYYNHSYFCSDCVNHKGTSLGLEFCAVCDINKHVVIWNGEQCGCGHYICYCHKCLNDTKCYQCGTAMCHWNDDTRMNHNEEILNSHCPQHCNCDIDEFDIDRI